jgi:hypothetical protein
LSVTAEPRPVGRWAAALLGAGHGSETAIASAGLAPGSGRVVAAWPVMTLSALSALDQRTTAAVACLELPVTMEMLLVPFGCIHGYAGGVVGLPALWTSITYALGLWKSPGVGRAGLFFYMYTAATGQCISGALKILINRTRPGMDGATAVLRLPKRHVLPGSPAFIREFPMEQLTPSPLVKIGGLQYGVTKGVNGSESGAFPSGDAMAGGCFAAMLGACALQPKRKTHEDVLTRHLWHLTWGHLYF